MGRSAEPIGKLREEFLDIGMIPMLLPNDETLNIGPWGGTFRTTSDSRSLSHGGAQIRKVSERLTSLRCPRIQFNHAKMAIEPGSRCPLATVGQEIKQWQPAASGLMIFRHEWASITGQGHQVDDALIDINGAEITKHCRHLCRCDNTSVNHPILQQGKRIIGSISNDIRMKHPPLCEMIA